MKKKQIEQYARKLIKVMKCAEENDIYLCEVGLVKIGEVKSEFTAEDFKPLPDKLLGIKLNPMMLVRGK